MHDFESLAHVKQRRVASPGAGRAASYFWTNSSCWTRWVLKRKPVALWKLHPRRWSKRLVPLSE